MTSFSSLTRQPSNRADTNNRSRSRLCLNRWGGTKMKSSTVDALAELLPDVPEAAYYEYRCSKVERQTALKLSESDAKAGLEWDASIKDDWSTEDGTAAFEQTVRFARVRLTDELLGKAKRPLENYAKRPPKSAVTGAVGINWPQSHKLADTFRLISRAPRAKGAPQTQLRARQKTK